MIFLFKYPLRVDFPIASSAFDWLGAVRKTGGPMLRVMCGFNLAKNLAWCSRGTAAKPHRNVEQTGADFSVSLRHHGIDTSNSYLCILLCLISLINIIICIYIYTSIYTHVSIYVTYIYIHIHIHMYVLYIYIYTIHTCIRMCICICYCCLICY